MSGRAMIIVAGGTSSRFGGDKLMAQIAGQPLLAHTVAAVAPLVDVCVLVCREEHATEMSKVAPNLILVRGGVTRTRSELAGLGAVPDSIDIIGIHDGARPLASKSLVNRLFEVAAETGGAVPVLATSNPLVRRSDLRPVSDTAIAQTPQVFLGPELQSAYRAAAAAGFEGHDTAAVVKEFSELTIVAVPGETGNIKVTYPADLDAVRAVLEPSRSELR
ncbi:MAG TPA: 2-C-methyl-D-erythritol 4-phosphate cytidylyltransferase [Acidimicrobiia bacterium]